MKNRTHNRMLHVVSNDSRDGNAVILPLGDASEANRVRQLLVSEALALEAQHGKNAYSDYLLQHHRRPSTVEAATIGRLLGGRVEADDGSLQPALNEADRVALRGIKARRAAASRRYDHILRLQTAIAALAANHDDPADVIASGSVMLDGPEIGLHLDHALCWLSRFAQEWHSREKETRA
ncbi:hypothetical protein [Bradyrhizobium sp. WSM3983]|uniref:hypothetical protein n=1 Tax=Bradyrhizobium sp. WSM3983 TaxID=1038867 RepID=UPI0012EC849F|nr:hypothetical protein [Bradyrhizobium sp. WSM3983]